MRHVAALVEWVALLGETAPCDLRRRVMAQLARNFGAGIVIACGSSRG